MTTENIRVPLFIALLLEFLFGPRAALAQNAPPPAPVAVATARSQTLAQSLNATGTVASRNDARLATEVAGRLEWVAEPGRALKKGEVVARIDDARLALALRDNEAAVRRLEANVALLASQAERLEPLLASNVVSRNQYDEAASRLQMAEQELESAKVARDRTRLDLERATVRAPFDGSVAERLQQAGEYVPAGGALVRLVDTRNVEVVARAPIAAAATIVRGQAVRVSDDERAVESRIRSVVPVGDERSRLLEIRIALGAGAWPIGSPVRVALATGSARPVVTVPRDAIIQRQGVSYVYRVRSDNTAERVPVEVGIGQDAEIQIKGKVEAGDRIVVRGGERLQPGQSVIVQGPAALQRDQRVVSLRSAPG
jgi:RND family efflux transporter MFP subunit